MTVSLIGLGQSSAHRKPNFNNLIEVEGKRNRNSLTSLEKKV